MYLTDKKEKPVKEKNSQPPPEPLLEPPTKNEQKVVRKAGANSGTNVIQPPAATVGATLSKKSISTKKNLPIKKPIKAKVSSSGKVINANGEF
jgi:hypothetical protein